MFCNGHPGTGSMTTPQEFYVNVVAAMEYLDQQLAPNSHIVFEGLVDGRILYDTMANRTHPIGYTHNDVTYADFYTYMNCLQISPCQGWMNTNATMRNLTTERANELNAVYDMIIANNTFKNFDMHYFPLLFNEVINVWTKEGHSVYELIEPVDGFHPSQYSEALLAQLQWENYLANFTELVPLVNPYNSIIAQLFGDQGGY